MTMYLKAISTFFVIVFTSTFALAGEVNLTWQSNPEPDVSHYNVYYGSVPRDYEPPIPVGNTTAYTVNNLIEGNIYYFSVTAVDTSGNESGFSGEVNRTVSTSSSTSIAISNLSTLSGKPYTISASLSNADAAYIDASITYRNLPDWLTGANYIRSAFDDKWSTGDQFLSFTIDQAAVVYVTHCDNIQMPAWLSQFEDTGADINLSEDHSIYRREFPAGSVVLGGNMIPGDTRNGTMYTVMVAPTDIPVADTTSPLVSITSPDTGGTYTTQSSTLTLSGTARDDSSVRQVTWAADTGASGTAAGTTSWTIGSVALTEGLNTITVTAVDAAGNTGTAFLTADFSPTDTAAPTVSITSPTSADSFASDSAVVDIAGTAADDRQLHEIAWTSSSGAGGIADGTANWTIAGIQLAEGQNVITITATDAAGNQASDSLTVTHTAPDNQAPLVVISSPRIAAGGTLQTTEATLQVSGTAQDDVGVTRVSWGTANDSGLAQGTTSWSIPLLALAEGVNTITVTAIDAAGNAGSEMLLVEYTSVDMTPPEVSITSPTTSNDYTAESRSIDLAGKASDDGTLSNIRWVSSTGQSGEASGTTDWTISGINLAENLTTITVTATDSAGNTAADTLTVIFQETDKTEPTVHITSPTAKKSFFSRRDTVAIGGTAHDNVEIAKVIWQNSRGESGTCSGTGSWLASDIRLDRWWNRITVTAIDNTGNTSETSLNVFRWR